MSTVTPAAAGSQKMGDLSMLQDNLKISRSSLQNLPQELLSEVFHLAALADPTVARSLTLVSSYVQRLIDPILFSTIGISPVLQNPVIKGAQAFSPPRLARLQNIVVAARRSSIEINGSPLFTLAMLRIVTCTFVHIHTLALNARGISIDYSIKFHGIKFPNLAYLYTSADFFTYFWDCPELWDEFHDQLSNDLVSNIPASLIGVAFEVDDARTKEMVDGVVPGDFNDGTLDRRLVMVSSREGPLAEGMVRIESGSKAWGVWKSNFDKCVEAVVMSRSNVVN
ncbi:hypothetical protein DL96DRAFT_1715770 [Flagelloscypha sp. PMI_526]|nr:hypothetical protein DL96DRAFT_1715770 [Flagelloscypha sp. PMI_526]